MSQKAILQSIKLGIVFILVTVLSIPASSSLAASNQRAQVIKDSYCFQYEGLTICYDNMAVVTETRTPSGNTIFRGSGWSNYSETDASGNVIYQDSLRYHTQGIMKESILFEFGQFFTYTVNAGSGTCTINFAFHLVNDEIQFERSTTCG